MIAIINYGLGNVAAIFNIYKRAGLPVAIVETAEELQHATRLILPGVGSFDWAMKRLEDSGLRPTLESLVLERGVPVLGICVGMQMMANSSEEGSRPGLGWIPGVVKRFDVSKIESETKLPHMGWNTVVPVRSSRLFSKIDSGSRFYFLHSYYFEAKEESDRLSDTDYCGRFSSSVTRGRIFGVQFHPEKSHSSGIKMLLNFNEI